MPQIATADRVEIGALIEFLRRAPPGPAHHHPSRRQPLSSPVTCGVDGQGRIVVSTYPERAKPATPAATRGSPSASCPTTGTAPGSRSTATAEVLDLPEALDGLVDYYRCISGEHPDWDEYRAARPRASR